MYNISEKEWAKIQHLVDSKNKEIKELKEMVIDLEVKLQDKDFKHSRTYRDNEILKESLCKMDKELKKEKSTNSLLLQKLNELFSIMERFGIEKTFKRKTHLDLMV